ncbi:dihydrofolate reductase family protein [Gammaproteobacteria bacterium]|jgi:riboflavin biosynthesis pyrimidine reductase|nr:riboflavin biosynthesis protein RibD [Pseudomonadota bacterium]MDB0063771.1 dihydrofolate reductase family protein [Gammaproteobacteria bacterium]
MEKITRLFPPTGEAQSVQGLYLRPGRIAGEEGAIPLVYANFLSSLDGRIALAGGDDEQYQLPQRLKSSLDFRLFLELYAHADCIITHGGYMRSLQENRLGNILQLPEHAETEYLHRWRTEQGLKPAPDVMIISGSLDFPWHDSLDQHGQKVHLATAAEVAPERIDYWREKGMEPLRCGQERLVDVEPLMSFLQQQGYRSVYLVAGPELLHDLLRHNYVQRYFTTISHQLLAGSDFKTVLSGAELGDQGALDLRGLFYMPPSEAEVGQWFAEFEPNHI